MKFWYRLKQLILLIGDLSLFFVALWISLIIRNLELDNKRQLQENLQLFIVIFLVWLMLNYINGLYDLKKISSKKSTTTLLQTAFSSFLISIVIFYILPSRNINPKTILVLTVSIAYLFIYLWRKIYINILINKKLKTNVLFLNYTSEVAEIIDILNKQKTLGYNVKAILNNDSKKIENTYQDIKIYENFYNLEKIIDDEKIEIIITNNNLNKEEEITQELYKLLFKQIKIINISSFYESITGRIPPSAFYKTWFLQYLSDLDKPIYNKFTRLIELFSILFFGTFFLILLPFIALFIKTNSKGKIFFKQKRLGKNGKTFWIYKFRTMYSLSKDGSAEIHGAEFAQKNDKRITSIGKILRKTRLDELPQVINLIKGEITVIGPRPERPEISADLEKQMPYYNIRNVIKPGITGWAQTQQHYTANLETSLQKFQYDLFYIKNRSILLDISILLKTVNVVLRAMGQ
ncbi:MAG: glycosyl transferase [uncultured bacterium]|nr:MAG: glycosyl transferase [uncultured bacterium]OGH84737.1 MAG: hypothetical protein A2488_03090 [Candidatus Magasanikbacteria bacterium RIFOXYC12_FULL_32_21b]HAO52554.1 hypothetical protein [Candidatus Magasanikbacteria bacterium]